MAISLKQELETNASAVAAFDQGNYSIAFERFEMIADYSSKMRFNMGIVMSATGQHDEAIEQYQAALRMDRYLAIAYFQAGVSNFLLGRFDEAQGQFDDAHLYLRGNMYIDYAQLGLSFKLWSCEVLFNRGLCTITAGNPAGLLDLRLASLEKQTKDHDVIDQAIREQGIGYTVFSIPPGVLYRPDEAKLRNIAAKDYLGKAKLVASIDASDVGTGFRGHERQQSTVGREIAAGRGPASAMSEVNAALSQFSFTSRANSLTKVDKHMTQARDLEFSRLDDALQRKASVSSVRSNFPPPIRSRSLFRRGRDIRPPTPPRTESRASSRKSSYASSTMSDRIAPPLPSTPESYRSHIVSPKSSNLRSKPLPALRDAQRLDESPSRKMPVPAGDPREVEAFSKRLDGLAIQMAPSVRGTRPSRNSSISSLNTSQHSLQQLNEDIEEDLIDDYYSQSSFSAESNAVLSRNVSVSSICRVKVRVHGVDDTRVVTVDSGIALEGLHRRLMDKFGWSRMPKLRTRDEDDEMILLQDQEDWDMCLEASLEEAQRAGTDIAKLEIWVKS